jgi:elongation factor P--(R)-beta-lysine ligase
MNSSNKIAVLRDRSEMLSKARAFFSERGLIEVDCPILSSSASVDAHIDLIPALDVQGEKRYLHSSPEYGMKRLLSEGMGDCYQLSHVFRQGEYGRKHNPEFMMAEWYRIGFTFQELIEETLEFIRLFVGPLPQEVISYREALLKYAGFDYMTMSTEHLLHYLQDKEIHVYQEALEEGKDGLLNIILGSIVEPCLGIDKLCALSHYPSTQAALAKTIFRGEEKTAERFEVYYQGIELANGYHELADPMEQELRLIEANAARKQMGKETLPIDYKFLSALKKGLPDCCGVAVGFDRLIMLRHKASSLANVIPFDWDNS